jgi:hypothetical protein
MQMLFLRPPAGSPRVELTTSAFGIDGLVEIDPEHTGEQGDRRRERQKQDDGPDCVFRDPPTGDRPEQCREERNDHDTQTVTHVHGAQKIARFALKLQIADRAALIHLGESAKNGIAKDASHAAAGTTLPNNVSHGREFAGGHRRFQSFGISRLADGSHPSMQERRSELNHPDRR